MKHTKRSFEKQFIAILLLITMPLVYAQSTRPTTSRTTTADSAMKRTTAKTSQTAKQNATSKANATYKLSSQRMAKIKSCIDSYMDSDLDDKQVIQKIEDEIAEFVPLVPQEALKKCDTASLREEARKLVEKKYGTSSDMAKRLEEEAKTKYPLYKVGDSVSLDYYVGSRHYSVKGKLIRIAQKSVTIDDKMVNLMDLGEEELAKFDAKKNQTQRSLYIRNRTLAENQIRLSEEKENEKRLQTDYIQRNEKAGYIYDIKTASWKTAQGYSELYIKEAQKKKIAEAKRLEEERRLAEEKRLEEERRLEEEKQLAEERRHKEERWIEEEIRRAEEGRSEEEKLEAAAQYGVGLILYENHAYQEAVEYLAMAAALGHARSQYLLGECYYKGQGVTKDLIEAVKWYKMAAEQGDPEGQTALGTCYYLGTGVIQDRFEGVNWIRKAAAQGFGNARELLKVMGY